MEIENKKASKFEKDTLLRLVLIEMRVADLYKKFEDMERNFQKLDEVYYHIFPDRLEKDRQIEAQLRDLNLPVDPSAPR